MKIGVVAAIAGGLIVGAGAMVPLGSFAQVGAPAVPPISNSQDVATIDPAPETPAPSLTPTPTPPAVITPPTFAAGGKTDGNDDDVNYGEENGEGHDDEGDDGESEGDD
ncbi:MAG: hypothetical protein F2529_04920 [Actinobacteria bacterium]|uniref:Unannotated protein n=1 Tax=freshwater metagenome TaxID=449393 RepID=A0A6J6CA39_9ZZZZ|nr:hypothetical protein [Actinomycetota bacterium]MTA30219.1 hypothetical protein [Actinomycetota bacterium]